MRHINLITGLAISCMPLLPCKAQIPQPNEENLFYMPWILPDSAAFTTLYMAEGENGIACFTSTDGTALAGRTKTEYFDDFGRLEQTVRVGATPSGSDIVELQEYDTFGRESKKWLPCPVSSMGGGCHEPEQVKTACQYAYGGDNAPFAFPVYEPSTLGRVLEQHGPGAEWQSQQKCESTDYLTNDCSDDTLRCLRIGLSGNTLQVIGSYGSGTLQVTRYCNEDGEARLEFRDRQERMLLSRKVMSYGEGVLDTYYVYDGLGNLCAVLPPALSQQAATGSITQAMTDKYAYIYQYDSRNRLSSKKLPGAAAVSIIYDEADRVVFTQDGVQAAKGRSTFHVYDVFGRECITGECLSAGSCLTGSYALCQESQNGSFMGYSVSGVTLNQPTLHAVNYYDSYDMFSDEALGYTSIGAFGLLHGYPRGLLTGKATLRLEDSSTATYDYTTFYYDEHGRVIQSHATNHMGGYEHCYTEYSHTGLPLR